MSDKKEVPQGFHVHSNGGGLVQDTCTVDSSAYVGPDARVSGNAQVSGDAQVYGNARVSGNAQVSGDARVSGNAQVYGDAQVYGNARVSGNAWVSSPLYIQGTKHALTNSKYGHIAIGCHEHTFEYWQEHYKAVGRAEGYTTEEIEQYGLFIQIFSKIGK
jgi:UDP-3-O-[3-hydroxymyristoyl] glucosamine N-acyltransferase